MQNLHTPPPLEILVGIDIGGSQHSIAVGLSDGALLDEFDIDHRPDSFGSSAGVKSSGDIGGQVSTNAI